MTKFAFVNDTHIRTSTPQSRKPCDFLEEVLTDLEFILEYCRKHSIPYLLHAGDLFDSENQTSRAMVKLTKLLATYSDVQVIMCLGNHDISDRNPKTWQEDTAVGILYAGGFIKVLYNGDDFELSPGVRVYGFGCNDELTEPLLKGDKKTDVNPSEFNIALIHYEVGSLKSKTCSITVDKLKINREMWNLGLFGDIHDFVEYGQLGSFHYCSNGALCKKTINDVGRDKLFSVFSLDNQNLTHSWVKLPCPPDDVLFSLEKYDEDDFKLAQAIVASLTRAKATATTHPSVVVETVGKNSKFSDEVIQKVVNEVELDGKN